MLLNLKQLFSGQEERMEFQETLDFSGVEFHEAFPFSSPVSVTGKITGNHGSSYPGSRRCFFFVGTL